MTSMGVQALGTILSRCVGVGDGKWGQKWEYISRSMKVYALGNLRVIYGSTIVLMGVIIRDFFPDPDVICRQLRSFQFESCRWICDLLLLSSLDKEVFPGDSRNAMSREELIRAIKERSPRGELSAAHPRLIDLWVQLIGRWPSLTSGGPRYILQVRLHFIHQVKVILDQDIVWNDKVYVRPLDDDDLFYVLFGIPRERLTNVNWKIPQLSIKFGPQRHENIQSRVLEFDPSVTSDYLVIVDLCKERRLPQRGAVVEWARLNSNKIPAFLSQMRRTLKFRGWFKCYYDTLRFMYERVTGIEALKITSLECELNESFRNQAEIELSKYNSVRQEMTERKSRVDWFEDARKYPGMVDRARLLHRLPQLSGKKGGKRGRSCSQTRLAVTRRGVQPSVSLDRGILPDSPSENVNEIDIEVLSRSPSREPSPPRRVLLLSDPTTQNGPGEKSSELSVVLPGDLEDNNVLSGESCEVNIVPGPSNVETKIPDVRVRKASVVLKYTYDEFLRMKFSKDSSSDEEVLEVDIGTDLLDSP